MDTAVGFNLTLLLPDHDGFADVAINLDAISCSAKVDCPPTELLFNPSTGERTASAMVAISCTGDAADATNLYMTDVQLVCTRGDGSTLLIAIAPSAGPGNHYTAINAPTGVVQAASYVSQSTLTSGGESLRQMTWTVAVAPDLGALAQAGIVQCKLEGKATASNTAWAAGATGYTSPANYPLIAYSVPVVSVSQSGNTLGTPTFGCGLNALNAQGSGVQASTSGATGTSFSHNLAP